MDELRKLARFSTLLALSLSVFAACTPGPNDVAVCDAYHGTSSGVEVIADGTVQRLLGTREGRSGEHEGFLLQLRSGCVLTLRVETNVDFTGPIPLRAGEAVVVKGEYEYETLGGVIHWTHRDPRGRHAGGYVEAGGMYYW